MLTPSKICQGVHEERGMCGEGGREPGSPFFDVILLSEMEPVKVIENLVNGTA